MPRLEIAARSDSLLESLGLPRTKLQKDVWGLECELLKGRKLPSTDVPNQKDRNMEDTNLVQGILNLQNIKLSKLLEVLSTELPKEVAKVLENYLEKENPARELIGQHDEHLKSCMKKLRAAKISGSQKAAVKKFLEDTNNVYLPTLLRFHRRKVLQFTEKLEAEDPLRKQMVCQSCNSGKHFQYCSLDEGIFTCRKKCEPTFISEATYLDMLRLLGMDAQEDVPLQQLLVQCMLGEVDANKLLNGNKDFLRSHHSFGDFSKPVNSSQDSSNDIKYRFSAGIGVAEAATFGEDLKPAIASIDNSSFGQSNRNDTETSGVAGTATYGEDFKPVIASIDNSSLKQSNGNYETSILPEIATFWEALKPTTASNASFIGSPSEINGSSTTCENLIPSVRKPSPSSIGEPNQTSEYSDNLCRPTNDRKTSFDVNFVAKLFLEKPSQVSDACDMSNLCKLYRESALNSPMVLSGDDKGSDSRTSFKCSPWDTPPSIGSPCDLDYAESNDIASVIRLLEGERLFANKIVEGRRFGLDPWDTPPSCDTLTHPSFNSGRLNPPSSESTQTSLDGSDSSRNNKKPFGSSSPRSLPSIDHTACLIDGSFVSKEESTYKKNNLSLDLDLFSSGPCFDYDFDEVTPFWMSEQLDNTRATSEIDSILPQIVVKDAVEPSPNLSEPMALRVEQVKIKEEPRNQMEIPIWINNQNSCWIDASLCLLAFNTTLGRLLDTKETSLLCRFYQDFQKARQATFTSECRAILEKTRLPVKNFLHCKLKTNEGQEESLLVALQQLLLVDKALHSCGGFQIKYRWSSYCANCLETRIDRDHNSIVPTFVKTNPDFKLPDNAVALTTCKCKASAPLEKCFKFTSLPRTFCLHFLNGLCSDHPTPTLVNKLAFVHNSLRYKVTGFIRYTQKPNHFTTYVRHQSDWLLCDNLEPSGTATPCQLSAVDPSEIHIVMWESQDKQLSQVKRRLKRPITPSNPAKSQKHMRTTYLENPTPKKCYPPYTSKFK